MQSVIPPGDPSHIVIAGKSQGWLGLAIHYGQTMDANKGGPFPTMTTAWQPTPEELKAINAGAPIVVQIIGTPPINPMAVYVGEIPDALPEQDVECSCGATVTFDKSEHHARCFNCGEYHHR